MNHLTIGILAHVDAGKTTLSEGLLYTAGAVRRIGRVDHGDAFLDTDENEERLRILDGLHLKITDDMIDIMAETKPFPKFAGIITGPSRTADIECVGTVGVHGPRQYSVIVVEDE